MLDINITAEGIEQAIKDFAATEDQAVKAMRSTLVKMSSWLRTRVRRQVSKELGLAADILRFRLKSIAVKFQQGGAQGGVWLGLNQLSAKHLNAHHAAGGVTMGGNGRGPHQSIPGAFMGPRPGTEAKRLGGHAFKRTGKGRLPIERVGMDIAAEGGKAMEAAAGFSAAFEAQFFKTFEHELKWRTQIQR